MFERNLSLYLLLYRCTFCMEFLSDYNNIAIKFQLVVVGCDVKIFIAVSALCTIFSRIFYV